MTLRVVRSQGTPPHDTSPLTEVAHQYLVQQSLAIAWRELCKLRPNRREDAGTSALLVKAVTQHIRLGERHPQRLALNALSALSICDND